LKPQGRCEGRVRRSAVLVAFWVFCATLSGTGPAPQDASARLRQAARDGDAVRVREVLIKSPQGLSGRDGLGYAALHWAALHNRARILEMLLDAGADIECPGGEDGRSALQLAALRGNDAAIRILLARGAGVNVCDTRGQTSLHIAAAAGHASAAGLLLRGGAAVYASDLSGLTPLHLACHHGHKDAARVLLAWKGTPHVKDNFGQTPLHLAAWGGHCALIEMLLARGAEIDAGDNRGLSPLQRAVRCGQAGAVRVLISRGADAAIKDDEGRTALDYARLFGFENLAPMLLVKRAPSR